MNRKTILLIAVPSLFGLSCCCAALALPFGVAGMFGWADQGVDVPTSPGTAAISLRAGEWYLGPGEPTYDVLVRRSVGDRQEYRRFVAQDVHDRLGIPELPPEGTYEVVVRTPDGRGGYYNPGVLQFLALAADTTREVVVVVHGGVDLHAIVASAGDGMPLADVDVVPDPFTYSGDGMPFAMVFGRTDAAGEAWVGGICGFGHGPGELERGITFRREGFRERRVHLTFPATCDAVTALTWRVPLEPLASTTMSIAADLTVTRLDVTSPAARAGLRLGDRVTAIAGALTATTMPTAQHIVEQFDLRDTEIWLSVIGSDGEAREIRATLREPDVGG